MVNGAPGEAAVLVEGSSLRIFFAEEMLHALPTSLQWFDAFSRHCKINDATSRQLLFVALTDLDYNRVCKVFASQGHSFPYLPTSSGKFTELYSFTEYQIRLIKFCQLLRCGSYKTLLPLWEPSALTIAFSPEAIYLERLGPKLDEHVKCCCATYVSIITERGPKHLAKDPALGPLDLRTRKANGRLWRPEFA